MKFREPKTLSEIALLIGAKPVGDPDFSITGINEIHVVEPGDIVFVDHPKYYEKALQSAATIILINKQVDCPEGKALLIHDDPFAAFNQITTTFAPFAYVSANVESAGVHPGAVIEPGAVVAQGVTVGEGSLIRSGAILHAGTVIGNNCIIHSGTVLGTDAFYYQKRNGRYTKMHSCGRVVVEDDVEIGALCTVDKGVTGDTIIGSGTRIDNQVHIGHDTRIGKNCLFAAHVGIAGCVVVEDNVTLWGQVGVIANVRIGAGAVVMGQSGVGKDLEGGRAYFGSPCEEARKKYRELASIKLLPQIIENLNS
jgi:UDP-3-O-[3-hydroxymyristoyl] glucosamine N-acyltransferase